MGGDSNTGLPLGAKTGRQMGEEIHTHAHPFGAPLLTNSGNAGLRVAADAAQQVQKLLGLGGYRSGSPETDPNLRTAWPQYAAVNQ